MNPQRQVCPHCGAEGKQGWVSVHSWQERRYRCKVCKRTFSHTYRTAFYRLKKPELFATVMTLLAYGCPTQAVVASYGLSEKTVRAWAKRAGTHCQQVHEQTIMEQQWDLQPIQADEMKVTTQVGVVWMALVMMVSTRLWLGGSVSTTRGKEMIQACLHYAARCALCRPLLLAVDGLNMYVNAAQQVFRSRHRLPGERPRWFVWKEIIITQVVKKRGGRRGKIERVVAQGDARCADALRQASSGGTRINSAFIERLNATFRQRCVPLVRRSRALARSSQTLTNALFLQGCVYNFCTLHASLSVALALSPRQRHWVKRTPAMAAGLTDHRWTVTELLSFPLARSSV
jgi:transposase-like protein